MRKSKVAKLKIVGQNMGRYLGYIGGVLTAGAALVTITQGLFPKKKQLSFRQVSKF